jgi:hypothetical protein
MRALLNVFPVALILASFACDDPKKSDAAKAPVSSAATATAPVPGPIVSATAATTTAATATAAGATLATRLKCTALLPESAMQGPLAGMKAGQPPATCADCGPTCSILAPGKPFEGATVNYVCNVKYDKAAVTAKLTELKKGMKKPTAITEFGRGGIGGEREAGLFYQLVVQDDDSDCLVTIDWMRGKREPAMAAAKAAIMNVKQADIAKP